MRVHRFYLSDWQPATVLVVTDTDLVHQWLHVFRMQLDQEVILCNGKNQEVTGRLVEIGKRAVTVQLGQSRACQTELGFTLKLAFALLKRENNELVLQKATELGVSEFIPLMSERTVKMDMKRPRLEAILKEAMEQSGRGIIPSLREPIEFAQFITQQEGMLVAFDGGGEASSILPSLAKTEGVTVCIGPEGGWSDAEKRLLSAAGAKMISLGSRTLRAETAAIAALALLGLE